MKEKTDFEKLSKLTCLQISLESFVENIHINKADQRGWYITENSGSFYLYNDGVIRIGTCKKNDNIAFWSTKKEAEEFFNNWK